MNQSEIETLLKNLFADPNLDFQVAYQEQYLQVVVNYDPTVSVDRTVLLDYIQEAVNSLKLPEVAFLALYTREIGQSEPDWTTCVELLNPDPDRENDEVSVGEKLHEEELMVTQFSNPRENSEENSDLISLEADNPPIASNEETNAPETTLLRDYCFIRDRSLLNTEILPPPPAVAQLVASFHQLNLTEKQELLPMMPQLLQQERPENITAVSAQEWIEELFDLSEENLPKLALWLSRYCFDPEQTLLTIESSVLRRETTEPADDRWSVVNPPEQSKVNEQETEADSNAERETASEEGRFIRVRKPVAPNDAEQPRSQPVSKTNKSRSRSKSLSTNLIITAGVSLVCGFLAAALVKATYTSESVLMATPIGWYVLPGMLFGIPIGILIAVATGTQQLLLFSKFLSSTVVLLSFSGWVIFPTMGTFLCFEILMFIGIVLGFSAASLVRYGSGYNLYSGLAGLVQGLMSFEALVATLVVSITFGLGWGIASGPAPTQLFAEVEEPLAPMCAFMSVPEVSGEEFRFKEFGSEYGYREYCQLATEIVGTSQLKTSVEQALSEPIYEDSQEREFAMCIDELLTLPKAPSESEIQNSMAVKVSVIDPQSSPPPEKEIGRGKSWGIYGLRLYLFPGISVIDWRVGAEQERDRFRGFCVINNHHERLFVIGADAIPHDWPEQKYGEF